MSGRADRAAGDGPGSRPAPGPGRAELRLRPGPTVIALVLAVGFFAVAVQMFLTSAGWGIQRVDAALIGPVSGYLAVTLVLRLRDPWVLVLDERGFTSIRPPLPAQVRPWTRCSRFGVMRLSLLRFVGYEWSDPRRGDEDTPGYLLGGYGTLTPAGLADLLNRYRDSYGPGDDDGEDGDRSGDGVDSGDDPGDGELTEDVDWPSADEGPDVR